MLSLALFGKLVFRVELTRTCSTENSKENSKENSERAPAFLRILKFSLERILFCVPEYQGNAKGTLIGTLLERVRVDFSVRLLLSSTVCSMQARVMVSPMEKCLFAQNWGKIF